MYLVSWDMIFYMEADQLECHLSLFDELECHLSVFDELECHLNVNWPPFSFLGCNYLPSLTGLFLCLQDCTFFPRKEILR